MKSYSIPEIEIKGFENEAVTTASATTNAQNAENDLRQSGISEENTVKIVF